ncbi:carbohydrate kinase family protein [Fervidobacterium changbaicum]|uniref:Carbohydrate kinase family protein n=2 Tax=Fervidobacterium changbaicum TaxID=310769 RepID=A0ABX5QRB1_9BACT|nr:carbohydrate kinase family protein [Fervidobacterium changbaicum]
MMVTCIGKANLDISYSIQQVHLGNNHVSLSVDLHLGGKAANVSVALKKLGIQSQLIADIGGDPFGQKITEELKTFGVISLLKVKPAMTGFTFIVVEQDGTNTMFNYIGANALLSLEDISRYESELVESDLVFYQASAGRQKEIIEYLKKLQCPIFIELSEPVEPELLNGIESISLNEEEALRVTRTENTFDALGRLLSFGVGSIFLKLGDKGAIYANRENIIYGKPYKISPVDTTGAGDAFTAGCIYGILNNMPVERILDFANKCGAITCIRRGTTEAFPTYKEVEN